MQDEYLGHAMVRSAMDSHRWVHIERAAWWLRIPALRLMRKSARNRSQAYCNISARTGCIRRLLDSFQDIGYRDSSTCLEWKFCMNSQAKCRCAVAYRKDTLLTSLRQQYFRRACGGTCMLADVDFHRITDGRTDKWQLSQALAL